jgi:hypothetical protein
LLDSSQILREKQKLAPASFRIARKESCNLGNKHSIIQD